MTVRELLIAVGLVATLFSGAVSTQAPAGKTPPPPAGKAAPLPSAPIEPPADNYVYDPQGRRDPFVTALGSGLEARVSSKQGAGVAGMATQDVTVRGVIESRGAFTALVQGADSKTYVVHGGDRLLDGVVKAVGPDGLTIVQDVNDPLSLVKTREVRKPLRSKEDGKP
ncbi:MAG TPA: hypothetical protein VHZ73_08605 [Vicinamibacterales bacterium]|nr:hypothetical protein [Vicinamibacterales bacterium]